MTNIPEKNYNEEPCRLQRFIEAEKERRKGTREENSVIIVNIYCGCPKCTPRY